MTTMWFDKRPGERAMLQSKDETGPNGPCAVLLTGPRDRPDWVRLPPELGGARVRVSLGMMLGCPCGGEHESWHLLTEARIQDRPVLVAECPAMGFLWHTRSEGA